MKQTELKKLVQGKDFTKDEDIGALLSAINSETNSLVSERDESIAELKKENESLKNSNSMFAKEKDDLNSQLAKQRELSDIFQKKIYISKNINNKLTDEEESDLLTLTNARLAASKDSKFEDVIGEVATKRHFIKEDEPTQQTYTGIPAPKVSSEIANQSTGDDKLSASDTLSWLGLGKKK